MYVCIQLVFTNIIIFHLVVWDVVDCSFESSSDSLGFAGTMEASCCCRLTTPFLSMPFIAVHTFHISIYIHTYMHTYMHISYAKQTHTLYIHIFKFTPTYIRILKYILFIYIHVHQLYTYIHTYIHTYIDHFLQHLINQ